MHDPVVNKLVGSGSNLEPVGEDNSWIYPDDSGPFTPEAIDALLDQVMTLVELAEVLELSYDSLVKAARDKGRLQARQSGSTWLSTIAAVKNAIEAGTLRPRK